MRLRVFVDFDGTITRNDVGNALFRRFGGEECDALIRAYREERLSAVECFRREAATAGRVSRRELLAFVDAQPIDPHFPDFVRFCREHSIGLTVVSDGLDLYIHRILAAHGLEDLPVVANQARLAGEGDSVEIVPGFPHTNAECSRCACCKRNVMLTASADDEIIVLVGEGYSDFCPARTADVIFARDRLQAFCQRENISYTVYRSFADVRSSLERLAGRRHFRKRTAAEHLRRAAFAAE